MASRKNWQKKIAEIQSTVPGTSQIDWGSLFKADPKILGDLVNDIIKVEVSQKGRPGKRSAKSADLIERDLLKLTNEDFAFLAFPKAMEVAMGDKSVRDVAKSSYLSKSTVHRLLRGDGAPVTSEQIEAIAPAVGKDPSYFLEYRAMYVCSAIYEMLIASPESSQVFYNKTRKHTNDRGGS